MTLTILTVCPAELDKEYLRLYREALLEWNREGLTETQVVFLPQRPLEMDVAPFEVVQVEFEQVGGYPVWDVMRSVREAWPNVRGDYVTFDHPEFIWGPGRLQETIGWLDATVPVYGLGNLRRPGDLMEINRRDTTEDISCTASEWFRRYLEEGRWDEAAGIFEHLQTVHWMYWAVAQQKPGPNPWVEDVFYARKDWLDLWGFASFGRECPFQDVYDLMQVAVATMVRYGLGFYCIRMPQSINRLIHLWHPRAWGSWTPEMRDWFLSQPERWQRTSFLDRRLWEQLLAFRASPTKDCKPVATLRFGPRGTAINFGCAVADWLNNGGVEAMKNYFEDQKEARLQ